MLDVIKKLDAATIKALAAATIPLLALIATLFGMDEKAFNIKADQVVQILLAFVTLGGIAWAAWARLFKPTPPLTQTALDKTRELIDKGELDVLPVPPKKQGGFALPRLLASLLLAASVGLVLVTASGCTGTRAAYQEADTLPDRAYVALEQYFAVLKEWKTIVTNPATPEDVREALKAAELKATPVFLGDDTTAPPRPSIRKLASLYQATQNAQTATELQTAVNDAVRALTDFSDAVKAARSKP